jgi:adenylate cyclase
MAVAMRSRVQDLAGEWTRRGHDLGFSIGIAQGFATLGRVGFEGRYDYAAIGSVTNLASRLCSDAAQDQILVTQRVHGAAQDYVVSDAVGERTLRGFSKPVAVYDIKGLDAARVTS